MYKIKPDLTLIHKNKFSKLVDPDHNFKVVARDIPEEVKEKIVTAIKDSPIVSLLLSSW